MSLKAELQTWSDALDAYNAQDFDGCIRLFENIADSSKIMFNIGIVQATTGMHEDALASFATAVEMDPYLAVGYFQSGVSNFLLNDYAAAMRDFEDAYNNLRTNSTIDYEQIGLKFRLYSCEVLFNQGLCCLYMGNEPEGMAILSKAKQEKQTDEHGVIDDAFNDRGQGYTVFSIPVGVLYRPHEKKLKNLKEKNYLGAAKLVAATDTRDAFTGFTGSTLANQKANGTFGSDGKGAGSGGASSLMRANTAASRVEGGSRGFKAAEPPARGLGGGGGGAAAVKPLTRPGRSNTLPDTRPLQPIPRNDPRPPTPPSSDDVVEALQDNPRPPPTGVTGYESNIRDTAYGGTEFLDYYQDDNAPPLPALPKPGVAPTPEGQPIDRVAKWARQNTGAPPPSSGMSLSRNPSVSDLRGGAPRLPLQPQGMMRSNTLANAVKRQYAQSSRGGGTSQPYDEEGYEGTIISEREMTKVRVKLRFMEDTRGMSISPEMALVDFVERVRRKFESPTDLPMKFKDSEETMISIKDDDDWESALDEAREAARGRAEGKLEIWLYAA